MGPLLGGMARLKFDPAKVAMTIDGNSLSDSYFTDLWSRVQALPPISNQFTISNYAHSGDTTAQMEANAYEVDASYKPGKLNILIPWELTNNVAGAGRTGAETIADTVAYIQNRQAYVANNRPGQKPWYVVLMTTLPRGDFLAPGITATWCEQQLEYINDYIRKNYRAMGAKAFIEVRQPGGPFDFTDVLNGANFPTPIWRSGERTHIDVAGNIVVAGYVSEVLKRLPAR